MRSPPAFQPPPCTLRPASGGTALALHLVRETVEIVFLRKLVGGTGEVAEQIATVLLYWLCVSRRRALGCMARFGPAQPVERQR